MEREQGFFTHTVCRSHILATLSSHHNQGELEKSLVVVQFG
jgi:hypothetical protein